MVIPTLSTVGFLKLGWLLNTFSNYPIMICSMFKGNSSNCEVGKGYAVREDILLIPSLMDWLRCCDACCVCVNNSFLKVSERRNDHNILVGDPVDITDVY